MARRFDVSGWCHERDRRWPDYHSQAAHSPWPQTHVFLRGDDDVRLWAAVRGGGGGSQQATFRNELEARLDVGWRAALEAGWPPDASNCLRAFEAAVQHAFVSSTEPFFAHEFCATWAVALTRGTQCAVLTLGTNRAALVRAGAATWLTPERSLFTSLRDQHTGPLPDLYKEIDDRVLNHPGDGWRGELGSFTWSAGDALALVTGSHPEDVTEPLIADTLSLPGNSAIHAQRLYEGLQTRARARASQEGSERRNHSFVRQAVAVVARHA